MHTLFWGGQNEEIYFGGGFLVFLPKLWLHTAERQPNLSCSLTLPPFPN